MAVFETSILFITVCSGFVLMCDTRPEAVVRCACDHSVCTLRYCHILALRHVRELPEPSLASSLVLDWITVFLTSPEHTRQI